MSNLSAIRSIVVGVGVALIFPAFTWRAPVVTVAIVVALLITDELAERRNR